jgi:hypothetical protein
MQTQQDLLRNQDALSRFLEEVRQRAIKELGLPIAPGDATSFRKIDITLPDLITWSTPDNSQTRERLATEIIKELIEIVTVHSITTLRPPGIRFEVQRMISQYVLVASIWY